MALEFLDELAEKLHNHLEQRMRRGEDQQQDLAAAVASLSIELVRVAQDQEHRIRVLEGAAPRSG